MYALLNILNLFSNNLLEGISPTIFSGGVHPRPP